MSETQAASSPAETPDVFNGIEPTMAEFSQWRETGEVPTRFKPAEPAEAAPADDQEKTDSEAQTESAGESETPKPEVIQEHKPRNAAQRIAQLEAAIEAEWGKDDPDVVRIGQLNATIDKINGRPKRKSEAAPPQAAANQTSPQQQPHNFNEWQKTFKPSQWIEEYGKANPEASYEDANFAMAVHVSEVRDQFKSFEQQVQAQRQALESQVNEAKERYEDFDEIKDSFLGKVLGTNGTPLIPVPVLSLINDSPRMADVLYTIGSDESELEKFVKMAQTKPNEAIRYIARVESLIDEEFSKQAATPGKAPEKKRTQAPPPPTPVGGGSTRSFDVNDESLSEDEWVRKRNAQLGIK